MWEAGLWTNYGGDKILSAGVVDVKGRSIETPAVVADRIRRYLSMSARTDCGFHQIAGLVRLRAGLP